MAILVPVLRSAQERAHRVVCLSNLKQLTLAWTAYAIENNDVLVDGDPFGVRTDGSKSVESWAGTAFLFPESRAALIEDPNKGALWPWIKDVDIYRCPRGQANHALTYTTVSSANGNAVEGTYLKGVSSRFRYSPDFQIIGKRVGSTTLLLTRMTDIVSPGASQRAVFIDMGAMPSGSDFYVHYLYPKWRVHSPPPKHHSDGVTLSMADGHVEYWKWKGRETVDMPCVLFTSRHNPNMYRECLEGGDCEPQTEDGMYDLQRLQKATWGRLGYTLEGEGGL